MNIVFFSKNYLGNLINNRNFAPDNIIHYYKTRKRDILWKKDSRRS